MSKLPEAFVTANSGGGKYTVEIKCETMADMHRWHDAVLSAYKESAALERHSLPGGAAGYRLVPEEPTEAMRDAFYSAWIFTKEQAMETEREECAAIAYTGGAVEMPTTDFATKLDCFWAGAAEARKLVGRLIRARSTQDKTPPRPEPEETVDGRPVFIPR